MSERVVVSGGEVGERETLDEVAGRQGDAVDDGGFGGAGDSRVEAGDVGFVLGGGLGGVGQGGLGLEELGVAFGHVERAGKRVWSG